MKKAFTLIEIIFVLVIIGILAVVIIPRTQRDPLREAAIQIISDIRYTQHLAMVDDKYDRADSNWYRNRWQILFGTSTSGAKNTGGNYAYTIFSDYKGTSTGNPDTDEIAVNPLDKNKLLSGGYSGGIDWEDPRASKKLNIGYSYGIDNIVTRGCGSYNPKRISFDNLGRPFEKGDNKWNNSTDHILKSKCTFTFFIGNEEINISIEPETGYVYLDLNAT